MNVKEEWKAKVFLHWRSEAAKTETKVMVMCGVHSSCLHGTKA